MRIGFAENVTGNATERLEILAETTDGRLVVRHITITKDLYDKPFVAAGSLQLRNKEDVKDIREIKIEG